MVCIKMPIYLDEKTDITEREDEPFPGYIYMDSMAFGMGECCFQMTLGSCSLKNATYMYDQLIPFASILIPLTASSCIFKGKLSAYDSRFKVISESVDDRTEEERNPNSDIYVYKSRYSPVYSYISENENIQDYHNDYPKMPINEEHLKKLRDHEVPPRLSVHLANLLVRDPLVIFEKKIYIEDKNDRSHFEGFNSTNWNSLRFKPPRVEDNDSCFKVEVRPSDLQLTPFENSAILTFTYIYSKIVFRYGGNFIIPITKVDENFERGYKNDAIIKEKFWWRVNGIESDWKEHQTKTITETHCYDAKQVVKGIPTKEEDLENIKELTLEEILCGCGDYIGLLPMMYQYIDDVYSKVEENKKILIKHLEFIEKRVKGILQF